MPMSKPVSSKRPKKAPSTPAKRTRKKTSSTSNRRVKSSAKRQSKQTSWVKRLLKRLFFTSFVVSLIAAIPFGIWVWYLDQELVAHFEGQKWQVPSEVYSAPTLLRSGDLWRKADLEKSLQQILQINR